MKKFCLVVLALTCLAWAWGKPAEKKLQFDSAKGEHRTMTMLDGSSVNYVAYEKLYYVTNVEDSVYQYLNVYVPACMEPAS